MMKIASRFFSRLAVMALSVTLVLPCFTCAGGTPAAAHAQSTEANITRLTANILAQSQIAHHPLDRELANKFLNRYLDTIDGRRSLFVKSDVEAFSAQQPELVRATVVAGDTQLAHVVWKRYLERLAQQQAFVKQQLSAATFVFDHDESYELDRDQAERPRDVDAAHALWLSRLRAEYLDEKLDDVAPDQIKTKLLRRYEQQLTAMQGLQPNEVTGIYLNALASVYDPHSSYLGREEMQSLEMAMNLSLFGIGATLEDAEGYCTVRDVIPGGPAARSVLKPGDKILAVAQADKPAVEITHMPLSRAVQLIRGPKGSRVTLTVQPASAAGGGGAPMTVSIIRDEVQLEDAQAKATVIDLEQGNNAAALRVGVIDLPSFYAGMDKRSGKGGRSVTEDVARLIKKLKAEKVRGIVLDLRKNGGGSLEEAIKLTGLFIRKGPVVQTRGLSGDVEVDSDDDDSELYQGPLIALTSRMSASASEILAGALQDYGRAVLVGDTSTYGKGTVQSILQLAPIMRENGLKYDYEPGALKVTIRKFYRPSGASTQLRGVASDVIVPSMTDVSEISESSQENPLPWDTVRAAEYDHKRSVKSYLEPLRNQSTARVASQPGFGHIRDKLGRTRERLATKRISLNEAQRRQDVASDDARNKALEAWWRERQQAAPKGYEIKLKDTDAPGLPAAAPFAALDDKDLKAATTATSGTPDHARLAGGAMDDLVLDEAVHILADYIKLIAAQNPGKPSSA